MKGERRLRIWRWREWSCKVTAAALMVVVVVVVEGREKSGKME